MHSLYRKGKIYDIVRFESPNGVNVKLTRVATARAAPDDVSMNYSPTTLYAVPHSRSIVHNIKAMYSDVVKCLCFYRLDITAFIGL